MDLFKYKDICFFYFHRIKILTHETEFEVIVIARILMPCFECLISGLFFFYSTVVLLDTMLLLFILLTAKQRRYILESNQFCFSALFWLSRIYQGSKMVITEELSASNTELCNWLVVKSLKTQIKFSLQAQETEMWISVKPCSDIPGWDYFFSSAHQSGHYKLECKRHHTRSMGTAWKLSACYF